MDLNQTIQKYSSHPLTHQLLMSFLKNYKRPNDKLKALKAEGVIESIKKGLYIAGPKISSSKPENFLLANQIYGPSYVSLETALSYHGLIPERVYETASMTTKTSKEFNTPAGLFTYTHLPLPYYAFGLNMVKLSPEQFAIIASPEKALCDKIVSTSGYC
jgi:predicted transcriptional regulator of viral defense system